MLLIVIALTVCLVSAAVLFTATAFTNHLHSPHLTALTLAALTLYAAVLIARPVNPIITNASILLVALFVSSMLGTLFISPSAVVPFCITAGIVDIFSSQVGVTAKLSHDFQTGSSALLQFLSLSFSVHDRLRPIVGISDLIIMTAIYFALRRAGHVSLLAFAAPVVGLFIALAVGLLVSGVAAIPFIATTTIAFVLLPQRRLL